MYTEYLVGGVCYQIIQITGQIGNEKTVYTAIKNIVKVMVNGPVTLLLFNQLMETYMNKTNSTNLYPPTKGYLRETF